MKHHDDCLHCAFAEAEAALLDGWRFYSLEQNDSDKPDHWEASASKRLASTRWEFASGEGDSPAAALYALAARLASQPDRRSPGK